MTPKSPNISDEELQDLIDDPSTDDQDRAAFLITQRARRTPGGLSLGKPIKPQNDWIPAGYKKVAKIKATKEPEFWKPPVERETVVQYVQATFPGITRESAERFVDFMKENGGLRLKE